jgi:DNA-binding response OmpR family regulator
MTDSVREAGEAHSGSLASGIDRRSVLLVEHDLALRRAITVSLRALGHEVNEAGSGAAGKLLLDHFAPDVLIVDFDYPEGRNASLIGSYRERINPESGFVIVTTTQRLTEDWRQKHEPIKVLFKPFDMRLLFKMLKDQEVEGTRSKCENHK